MTEQNRPLNALEEFEPVIDFFGRELSIPEFSDSDARIEYYTLSKGLVPEIQDALMSKLEQSRPHVAHFIREELDRA